MQDDDRYSSDAHNPNDGQPRPDPRHAVDDDVPASVMFMEMMRAAAAEATRKTPRPPASRTAEPSSDPTAEPDPASPTDSPEYAAKMAQQRARRQQRRRVKRRQQTVGVLGGILRSVIVVVAAAGLLATIFTWWTPSGFIQQGVQHELSAAIATSVVTLEPTRVPTPNWLRRIGIVSGHRGPENDPGAVCPDGLTETEINFTVAQLVVRNLRALGYTVDLLDEFDPRLDNYEAAALVSIHANTCQDFGEFVSGYLISAAAARISMRGHDDILVDCIARHYQTATGLNRLEGVTEDMTNYHTFREIHPRTPAAILELGFMLADRDLLTNQPDLLARAITDGVLCFMEPGRLNQPAPNNAAAEPSPEPLSEQSMEVTPPAGV